MRFLFALCCLFAGLYPPRFLTSILTQSTTTAVSEERQKLEKSFAELKAAQAKSQTARATTNVSDFSKQLQQLQATSSKEVDEVRQQLTQLQRQHGQLADAKKAVDDEVAAMKASLAAGQQNVQTISKLTSEIAELKKSLNAAEDAKSRSESEKKTLLVRLVSD